jgi:hypothetical protein
MWLSPRSTLFVANLAVEFCRLEDETIIDTVVGAAGRTDQVDRRVFW